MSLDHAILGFLSHKSLTGYDLKKEFDSTVWYFWPAQQSQIYRTLSKLIEREHVSVEVVPQKGRPNRKVHHITESGRRALRKWLAEPHPDTPSREPYLVQVFFSGALNDEEILSVLRAKAEAARDSLAFYEERFLKASEDPQDISPRDRFFRHLTLEYGLESLHTGLRWIEKAMERVERGDYQRGKEGIFPPGRAP